LVEIQFTSMTITHTRTRTRARAKYVGNYVLNTNVTYSLVYHDGIDF